MSTEPAVASPTPTTIVLVRHGQTEWNRTHRIQGSSEVPLNDTGRRQAEVIAAQLAEWGQESGPWDAIYSSPLGRALETAETVADRVGTDAPLQDPEVKERDYGPYEGRPYSDYDLAVRGAEVGREPELDGVEPRAAVRARMSAAVHHIASRHPGGRVIVVTHGGAIRGAVNALAPEFALPRIPNCSATVLEVHASGHADLVAFDRFDAAAAVVSSD